jgi:hypothetical protein
MRKINNIEQISSLVKTSRSFREVLIQLGVSESGGNYKVLQRFILKHEIDASHFLGKASNKGRTFKSRPLEDYLVKNGPLISSLRLKKRLIREGILEQKCYNCGLIQWLKGILPLELEHIDGDTRNNERENLTLLCPNCHALTPTYRGKNKK